MAVTDDFNRSNGALGANWTAVGDEPAPSINTNAVIGNGIEYGAAFYDAVTFNATHTSQIVKANASNYVAPAVRMVEEVPGFGKWVGYFNHGDLQVCTGGVASSIGSPVTFASGDTAKLSVNGNVYTMSKNGSNDPGGTVTDATLSNGSAGFIIHGSAATIDNWEGTGEVGAASPSKRVSSLTMVGCQ